MKFFRWFAPLNPPIADWRGRRVWLVGASSGIGRATAVALHALGASVHVSGAQRGRPGGIHRAVSRAPWPSRWMPVTASRCWTRRRRVLAGGPLDLVVYFAGHYRELQRERRSTSTRCVKHLEVNYLGALHVVRRRAAGAAARGQRPPEPARQRGWLPRPAPQRRLRADQGRTDPPGRVDVPGPAATWPGRQRRESGLRRHAADGAKRLRDAGPHQRRRGRAARCCVAGPAGVSKSTFHGASPGR